MWPDVARGEPGPPDTVGIPLLLPRVLGVPGTRRHTRRVPGGCVSEGLTISTVQAAKWIVCATDISMSDRCSLFLRFILRSKYATATESSA